MVWVKTLGARILAGSNLQCLYKVMTRTRSEPFLYLAAPEYRLANTLENSLVLYNKSMKDFKGRNKKKKKKKNAWNQMAQRKMTIRCRRFPDLMMLMTAGVS